MKRSLSLLLALTAALTLTACQKSAETDYSQPLETPGIAAYELSEEGAYLVNAYGLGADSWIYRFRSPEGAAGFNVNAYTLSETGEWVETGLGGLSGDPQPEGGFSGVFTLVREKDGSLTLHILSDGARYELSTDPVPLDGYAGTSVHCADNAPAAVGEEIPVLLIGYTAGDSMLSFNISDFFTPEDLSGLDFVQAVTVEFTGE